MTALSKPTDLPAVRAELLTFFTERGPGAFGHAINNGQQLIRPGYDIETDSEQLARGELYRLQDAELFWVSADMTNLAEVAAETLPDYRLQPEDLPAPNGLIVFQRPVAEVHVPSPYGGTEPAYVRAASWGPTPPGLSDGVWVTFYTDAYLSIQSTSIQNLANIFGVPVSSLANPEKADEMRRAACRGMPALIYDNEAVISYSDGDMDFVDPRGEPIDPSDSPYPLGLLRTTWTLMQQPIAQTETAEFNRSERRRLQRAQVEPGPVRVINLRRPKASGAGADSDREYHHRWIVRGHWRQQWYPARQVHRPVWIAPHVKGPDDAPLIGGDKVHAWRR